jgi:hypothetical protein
VRRKGGKWRMCVDYTGLNKACPKVPYPLPRIDQIVDFTRNTTQLVSLALITKVLRTRMGKKKSDPSDKNSNEHNYLSLTSH